MNPLRVFIIRAICALIGSLLICYFFFGEIKLSNVGMFGAIMLVAAYVSETIRNRK